MAATDLYPPDALAALRQTVDESGEGWRWPFPGLSIWRKMPALPASGNASKQ